jgi:photosystem II stability/assembly factor-like uncharacterized protein
MPHSANPLSAPTPFSRPTAVPWIGMLALASPVRSCLLIAMIVLSPVAIGLAQSESPSIRPAPASRSTIRTATAPSIPSVCDGALHACAILSIDRAIAIGDRGLILTTEDGGKQWKVQSDRTDAAYLAIGLDPFSTSQQPATGLIVGGKIEPLSGRSVGVVSVTNDDGQTWRVVPTPGLPRLTGLQRLGYRHWLAWGDWSDHWQSALFETLDGGNSWSARPAPCGHIRSAAISDEGKTILIDRANRVFQSHDGMEYQTADITADPFHPLRFCKKTESGWWIGGDRAKLYRSVDGLRWDPVRLPGNALDHDLISLSSLECRGATVWVVGHPGNVVWRSNDAGQSWEVISTNQNSQLHAIAALDENVLMACGAMGRILQSRNRGHAWWTSHRAGERLSALAIASTERTVPWDVLTYITHEGKRRAAAFVLHDQHFGQSLAHAPEWSERLSSVSAQLHLEQIHVCADYPVGDLRSGIRPTDLAYYRVPSSGSAESAEWGSLKGAQQTNAPSQINELVRRMVLEIRTGRPDVLVTEDVASSQPLETANAVAANQAAQLAGSPSFRLFSESSGMDLPPWTVQRTLVRSAQSGGFHLAPTMLMNTSGILLSDAMAPVRHLVHRDPYRRDPSKQRATYRLTNQRTSPISQPLEGLILDSDTALIEPLRSKTKLPMLMASVNAPLKVAELLKTRGSGLFFENAWDDALASFAKSITPESAAESLWTIAIESRRQGNWHRWQTSLQALLDKNPDGPMAEVAYREWMTHSGSAEVRMLIDQQLAAHASKTSDGSGQGSPTADTHSSPFASPDPSIAKVAFERPNRLTAIARSRGTQDFSQMLARWPDAWHARKSEPEWAWLITSRHRTQQLIKHGNLSQSKESFFWPPYHAALSDWNAVHNQEKTLLESPESIRTIPWVQQRPYLDGKADEGVWSQSLTLPLITPWTSDAPGSIVRICRDHEFLYVHSYCPQSELMDAVVDLNGKKKSTLKPTAKSRQRDALNEWSDHVKLKIDLDRDYASWLELGWDIGGETLDQCNDMRWWNPTWYVAHHHEPNAWSTELAIPIASLCPALHDPSPNEPAASENEDSQAVRTASSNASAKQRHLDWSKQVWAISITRERPSVSTESLVAGESDRWSNDQWLLLAPEPITSSKPDPSIGSATRQQEPPKHEPSKHEPRPTEIPSAANALPGKHEWRR